MSYDCNRCSHSASLHWASQELGRDECMDECHAPGCSCANYEGPKDVDSADDREPIAEADAAEAFAQNCAKRRREQ